MKKTDDDYEKRRELEGLIFLSGEVNRADSENICKEVIKINQQGDIPWIQLIINSQGGYCSAGFAIVDIIEWSQVPVYTTGIGQIASMGLLIFMSGEKGRRVLTPRTSVLSHRYSGGAIGNHSQLVASRKEQDLMHERIVNHYIQHSKLKNEKDLYKVLLRDVDTWLSPEEAVSHGLADLIEKDRKIKYPGVKVRSEE